jgi:hypothetical protein
MWSLLLCFFSVLSIIFWVCSEICYATSRSILIGPILEFLMILCQPYIKFLLMMSEPLYFLFFCILAMQKLVSPNTSSLINGSTLQ